MMYQIPVGKFDELKTKVGNICQVNTGQPCEELHGTVVTLKDDSEVMIVHAVNADKANIIADDSEITKVGGEAIEDYKQWMTDNVKPPSEEMTP